MPSPEDRAAWIRRLVAEYQGPLLRYALRFTQDLDRARDVVQETFLRLCRKDHDELEGREAEWLFAVCRNRALDFYRKEVRMQTQEDGSLGSLTSGEPQDDPAAALERRDQTEKLLRLVQGLPERQREVVRLKYQDRLSYREIGSIVGISVSNVGYLIHTALRSLRASMQAEPTARRAT